MPMSFAAHRFQAGDGLLQIAHAFFGRTTQPLYQQLKIDTVDASRINAAARLRIEQFFLNAIHD
jgi:hypothetical protein